MRKTSLMVSVLCLTIIGSLILTQNISAQKKEKPTTVQSVDLNKYDGV